MATNSQNIIKELSSLIKTLTPLYKLGGCTWEHPLDGWCPIDGSRVAIDRHLEMEPNSNITNMVYLPP